jgi:hypothetical protein
VAGEEDEEVHSTFVVDEKKEAKMVAVDWVDGEGVAVVVAHCSHCLPLGD